MVVPLAACMHAYDDYRWTKERDVSVVTIQLVEDISECKPGEMACARYLKDQCTIYVPKDSAALTGHEAAHCLGYGH